MLLNFICFVFALQTGSQSSYCQSEDNILCKKCPTNAICNISKNFRDFECKKGFLKNKEQCLFTSFSEENLKILHIQVMNLMKNQSINNNINLQFIAKILKISENDARAAILFDEDYLINDNNKIIIKPPPMNSTRIRLVFLLLTITFVLILLKPSYDNYGALVLSVLFYFLCQIALNKLIKGLL